MTTPRRLPDWPRVMSVDYAAAYVGLSVSGFLARVAPHLRPVRPSARRVGYLREDLDAWIDRLAGRGAASGGSNSWD